MKSLFFSIMIVCLCITLKVDARDASRRVLHANLQIPARPGPLTLVYPKWIPGEHGPTGPISDLTGLKLRAAGRPIAWRRDPLDNYSFQLEVPAGADAVDATLDFLLPSDPNGFTQAASSSAKRFIRSLGAARSISTLAATSRWPRGRTIPACSRGRTSSSDRSLGRIVTRS